MTKDQAANISERALWTGAQATVALLVVELADQPVWWAAPLALVLSSAKTWIQEQLAAKADG